MSVERKMIKIPHRGPINEIGGVFGPISSPYMEKTKTIIAMLKTGKKVTEVLPDGTEIALNLENYNADLSVVAPVVEVKKKEWIAPTLTVTEPVVEEVVTETPVVEEEVIAPVVEEVVETPVVEEVITEVVEEVPVEKTPATKPNNYDNKPKWNNKK
jgi:hypothetical protein